MVVLPEPGGPHRIIECRRCAATISDSSLPGPRRCSWPTTSSRLCGRILSASGCAAGFFAGNRLPDGAVLRFIARKLAQAAATLIRAHFRPLGGSNWGIAWCRLLVLGLGWAGQEPAPLMIV